MVSVIDNDFPNRLNPLRRINTTNRWLKISLNRILMDLHIKFAPSTTQQPFLCYLLRRFRWHFYVRRNVFVAINFFCSSNETVIEAKYQYYSYSYYHNESQFKLIRSNGVCRFLFSIFCLLLSMDSIDSICFQFAEYMSHSYALQLLLLIRCLYFVQKT